MELIKDLGYIYRTKNSRQKTHMGIFMCECGEEARTSLHDVKRKQTTSCGCLKHKKTLIAGIGVNDETGTVRDCMFYRTWRGMIKRGYSDVFKDKNKSYKDVTVCKEWHLFSNFKKWMEQQDWEGKELDKDILYPNIDTPPHE